MASTKFKSCLVRFSLLTLAVCMLIACAVFGWKVQSARAQRESVNWIEKTDGHVIYSHMLGEYGQILRNPKAPGPEWLRNVLGIDFFDDVVVAYVNGKEKVSDVTPLTKLLELEILDLSNTNISNLTPLAGMLKLKTLFLNGTRTSDLTPLAGLANLEVLFLQDTDVSNVSALTGLKNLRILGISGTNVSKEDYKQLQAALPKCRISK